MVLLLETAILDNVHMHAESGKEVDFKVILNSVTTSLFRGPMDELGNIDAAQ